MRKRKFNTQDEIKVEIPDTDALNEYLHNSGIDSSLARLVKIRASQLNNCGYCTDIHTQQAKRSIKNRRIVGLNIWSEISFYSNKERAALVWTEVLTRFPVKNIKEEFYEEVSFYLSSKEIEVLSNTIVSINNWK